jgi:hypothetical protein
VGSIFAVNEKNVNKYPKNCPKSVNINCVKFSHGKCIKKINLPDILFDRKGQPPKMCFGAILFLLLQFAEKNSETLTHVSRLSGK